MFDPQREERQRSEKPKRKEKKKWVKQRGRVIDDPQKTTMAKR